MNQEQVIEKINVIAFDVTCVSGTISRESGSDATVFTPGAVRYIDPSHLRAFTSARQAANRACRARGVRFLSGWAVPDVSVAPLISELNEVALKVANAKTDLIQNWDTNIQAWVEGHPQVAGYRGRFPTKRHADKQTSASLAVYRIHPRRSSQMRMMESRPRSKGSPTGCCMRLRRMSRTPGNRARCRRHSASKTCSDGLLTHGLDLCWLLPHTVACYGRTTSSYLPVPNLPIRGSASECPAPCVRRVQGGMREIPLTLRLAHDGRRQ